MTQLRVVRIHRHQSSGAQALQISKVAHVGVLNGLSAAVDTAAGAGHELDEVEMQLAAAYSVQHPLDIVQAGSGAHPYGPAGQFIAGLLDALHAPEIGRAHV